jgi:hypothetical protein
MSGWSLAWRGNAAADDMPRTGPGRAAVWACYAAAGLIFGWLVLYGSGIVTTLGSAEGSERHGANAVRLADDGSFGLPTMYLAAGQTAWWDYDLDVEGEGGVRLIVAKAVPTPDFIVRVAHLRATARGHFAVVVPASGFYSFSYELEPIGGLFGEAGPGSTRYRLRWGVD